MAEKDGEDHIEEQDKVLELKRVKRARKTAVTKVKHAIEKLCARRSENDDIELIDREIDNLSELLERSLETMDELACVYTKVGEKENKQTIVNESNAFETEIQETIRSTQRVVTSMIK